MSYCYAPRFHRRRANFFEWVYRCITKRYASFGGVSAVIGPIGECPKKWYLVHPSISSARRRVIERVTRFSRQVFSFRYLGFPLYIGRSKPSYLEEVGQAMLRRIVSWKSKFLSWRGETYLGQACFDVHSSTFAGNECDTNLGVKNGGKGMCKFSLG